MIDISTLNELVACKLRAVDMSDAFRDAIKAQAEKFGVNPKSLRAAVSALAKRNEGDVKTEADEVIMILSAASNMDE